MSSETNEGDWSGRAEQLLQQQLKNVQEECRYMKRWHVFLTLPSTCLDVGSSVRLTDARTAAAASLDTVG